MAIINKTRTLTSFNHQRNKLITLLTAKTAAAKITTVNRDIDSKYRADGANVHDVLNAIEAKFKRCESLYFTYFEDPDHDVLIGNITNLPVGVDCELMDGTSVIKYYFSTDDRNNYKEIVDLNFQTFILTVASLYENLVLLSEIFMKKVIVYIRKPLSSPLHDYLDYLKLLITLGYRGNDKLNQCMTTSAPFLNMYLSQINGLRNKFIHGYSINLESDGFNYYVKSENTTIFTPRSADLLLHVFTKEVLDQTGIFIANLMTALERSAKHHRKSIPA
ncbi:hypothetical protein [Pedobacter gandavensis]|uniref:hypothetical protein n=1 Tax=Pedobacter gandavensis TaxID=2679963 RepID=UPI00293131E9|nr:hypothetical protein [Pedobacter gandavensis]